MVIDGQNLDSLFLRMLHGIFSHDRFECVVGLRTMRAGIKSRFAGNPMHQETQSAKSVKYVCASR